MHITEFIDYLKLEKNYSPHTLLAYTKDIEGFKSFLQVSNIDELTYADIRSWIVDLVEKGLSNRSVNRKIASLKSYYTYLVRMEIIDTSPLLYHQSLKTNSNLHLAFSHIEMEEAFDSLEKEHETHNSFESLRDLLIFALLYTSGMRRAELIGLDIKDIDLGRKQVSVLGKGAKYRLLPLLPWVTELIEEYLVRRSGLEKIHDKEALLLTLKGKRIYPSLVYRLVNTTFSHITGKQVKSPHILRHTFATHLLDEGADLVSIKELLGHSSLDSTQVYVHNSMEKIRRVYKQAHPRSKKQ